MVTFEKNLHFNTCMDYTTQATFAGYIWNFFLEFSIFKIFIEQSNVLSELVHRCQKKSVHF